jgi:biofilm protein TabA
MKSSSILIDQLINAQRYYQLHSAFEKAFSFLLQSNLAEQSIGRHDIDGNNLYCLIQKGPGRSRTEAKLEAHRKYIDIQYIISGIDEMGWKPTDDCHNLESSYDDSKDIEFFKDEPLTWTKILPGMFTIFFPEDAHAPSVSDGEIHKAVLKVLL